MPNLTIKDFRVGDEILVKNTCHIEDCEDHLTNGKKYAVTQITAEDDETYAFIIVIGDDGEEMPILESEFSAIEKVEAHV